MRLISGEEKLGGYITNSFTAEGLIERSGVTRGLPNDKFIMIFITHTEITMKCYKYSNVTLIDVFHRLTYLFGCGFFCPTREF